MRAILLAAGEGTRLRPYTADRPKCAVELLGKPLIEHQLATLRGAGVDEIAVVAGYRAEHLAPYGDRIFFNRDYASTNMVASWMTASEWLDGSDDVLVAYTDIVYEPRIVGMLAESTAPCAVAVDSEWRALWEVRMENPLDDAETLRIEQNKIVEIGEKPTGYAEIEGQYLGLVKWRRDTAPRVAEAYRALRPDWTFRGRDRNTIDMTSFLAHWIASGEPVEACWTASGWLEVDSVEDLETYQRLAETGELAQFWSPKELSC